MNMTLLTTFLKNWHSQISPFEGKLHGMAILVFGLILSASTASAQTFSETNQQTARFQEINNPDNALYIHNIQGDVTVEGYNGNEVKITYSKELEADNPRELERAKEEIQFIVDEEADRIHIYIDAPFINIKKWNRGISYTMNEWDQDYQFHFDISVQVPQNTNLDLSTINNGKVLVENVQTKWLEVSNVNGAIELMDVSGMTDAHTVNGNITASYRQSSGESSSYQTINGTIDVTYPENLSADISFKSLNGDLYTDFQNVQRLQNRVKSDNDNGGDKTTYRIDKFAPLRIGGGGPELSFEVLNGDVYIKRNRSI